MRWLRHLQLARCRYCHGFIWPWQHYGFFFDWLSEDKDHPDKSMWHVTCADEANLPPDR